MCFSFSAHCVFPSFLCLCLCVFVSFSVFWIWCSLLIRSPRDTGKTTRHLLLHQHRRHHCPSSRDEEKEKLQIGSSDITTMRDTAGLCGLPSLLILLSLDILLQGYAAEEGGFIRAQVSDFFPRAKSLIMFLLNFFYPFPMHRCVVIWLLQCPRPEDIHPCVSFELL